MGLKEVGYDDMYWTKLVHGPLQGCREYDNEPLSSINGGKFLDQLSDNQLSKKNVDAWNYFRF
jgi:hypothetical protein